MQKSVSIVTVFMTHSIYLFFFLNIMDMVQYD